MNDRPAQFFVALRDTVQRVPGADDQAEKYWPKGTRVGIGRQRQGNIASRGAAEHVSANDRD
jgi:hypothetical protein